MKDLINRRAAINILMRRDKKLRESNWYQNRIAEYECRGIDEAIVLLEDMPSENAECEDAVSRKAVYEAMVEKGQHSRRYKLGETWELDGKEIREALDAVPSVTPQHSPGKWIIVTGERHMRWRECSECHAAYDVLYAYDFCPKCGAKMNGGQDAKTV